MKIDEETKLNATTSVKFDGRQVVLTATDRLGSTVFLDSGDLINLELWVKNLRKAIASGEVRVTPR